MIEKLKTPGFWYLASPYSHPSEGVRQFRAFKANDYVGKLLALGLHVYSPIWATHRIAGKYDLPTDHDFWNAFNTAFIDSAVGVIVAGMTGWQDSEGCMHEIEYARANDKPVWLCDGRLNLTAL